MNPKIPNEVLNMFSEFAPNDEPLAHMDLPNEVKDFLQSNFEGLVHTKTTFSSDESTDSSQENETFFTIKYPVTPQ